MDLRALFITAILAIAFTTTAHASKGGRQGSVSVIGNYSKTTYGEDSYSVGKRVTASFGYNLTDVTELEISYMTATNYSKQSYIQTMNVEEQSLSGSVVQTLVPPDWVFQPYVKGGAAQYNRKQNGTVYGIPTRESATKSPSFIAGAGAKVFFLQNFSLKFEAVMYFPDFEAKEGKNNVSAEGGLSWNF